MTTTETNRLTAFTAPEDLDAPMDSAALQKDLSTDHINIKVEDMLANTEHIAEPQRYLIRWMFFHSKQYNIGWNGTSALSTLSIGLLYKIWTDRYRDKEGNRVKLDGVCETLSRCKRLVDERGVAQRMFVRTSVAAKIFKMCDEARLMETIVFIFGEAQIGKTYALEEYAHLHNSGQTIYFRMPASAGVQEMMKELAEACFVGRNSKLPFNKLKAKVRGFLDHTKLIVVDEAHLLFETYQKTSVLRCLETLRELHDRTGCGLVICATEVFEEEMDTGEFARMLKQFRRRGIYRVKLPKAAPREDWLAIAAAYKLSEPRGEAEAIVTSIIAADGLGKFCKFLRKASQMAGKRKERLSWDHFTKAHDIIARLGMATKEAA